MLCLFGVLSGRFRSVFGASWAVLEPPSDVFGASWTASGATEAVLEPSWTPLGNIAGPRGRFSKD
eukprot:1139671-Pyramimonas_sp.AAC.1